MAETEVQINKAKTHLTLFLRRMLICDLHVVLSSFEGQVPEIFFREGCDADVNCLEGSLRPSLTIFPENSLISYLICVISINYYVSA